MFSAVVKLTDPRKYFVQHAARLPYTAAWSSDNVKVIMKASNEPMMIERRQSSHWSRTLLPTCKIHLLKLLATAV
uniref:Uncharacterized protein n=1 Tax=Oryza rufipogon TaxID=4529 RepID=A0A0E0PWS8_ORYRU